MTKKILMAPFHYPPMKGSSGVQRSLFFSSCLENHGWSAIVLTAHSRAHPDTGTEGLKDIPKSAVVKRTFAVDAARHLSIGGRFPRFLALPDRWSSWILSGVWSGFWAIKKYKPAVIWTTYPIASSHFIGYLLHKLTNLPWVADFRDPMTEEDYPRHPTVFKLYRWLEKKVMQHARYVVVTTPGVKRVYEQRYANICRGKIKIIQNGFDENKFAAVESGLNPTSVREREKMPIRLVHSGVIYPEERDPEPLFSAISELKKEGAISANKLSVELRATAHDDLFAEMLSNYDIEDIVKLLPAITHEENIADMLSADVLLLLQGSTCNEQIPAKAYEYIRTGKPVVALTDEKGDTGQLLKSLGVGIIAALESKDQIKQKLSQLETICRNFQGLEREKIQSFSRQSETKELAQLLATIA